jgi:hypothetical protein
MPENPAPSDYDVRVCDPQDLSATDRGTCIALIKGGGAVDPGSAERELPRTTSVVTARQDGRIVGVGAIKRVRREYALDKTNKSGVTFPPETPELGYVAVDSGHQGKGLSYRIVAELIATHGGPKSFFYSLPLKIAAITRGLRLPCMTATTQSGFSSGA